MLFSPLIWMLCGFAMVACSAEKLYVFDRIISTLCEWHYVVYLKPKRATLIGYLMLAGGALFPLKYVKFKDFINGVLSRRSQLPGSSSLHMERTLYTGLFWISGPVFALPFTARFSGLLDVFASPFCIQLSSLFTIFGAPLSTLLSAYLLIGCVPLPSSFSFGFDVGVIFGYTIGIYLLSMSSVVFPLRAFDRLRVSCHSVSSGSAERDRGTRGRPSFCRTMGTVLASLAGPSLEFCS